jgi:hypothetical protein
MMLRLVLVFAGNFVIPQEAELEDLWGWFG